MKGTRRHLRSRSGERQPTDASAGRALVTVYGSALQRRKFARPLVERLRRSATHARARFRISRDVCRAGDLRALPYLQVRMMRRDC